MNPNILILRTIKKPEKFPKRMHRIADHPASRLRELHTWNWW